MTKRVEAESNRNDQAILWFLKHYPYFGAAVIVAIGLVLLSTSHAPGDGIILRKPDTVFGISNRAVLLVVGSSHLVIAGCLFLIRDSIAKSLAILWVGTNHFVYGVGMVWLKVSVPFPTLQVAGRKFGIGARQLDLYWKLFVIFLVVGGVLHIVLTKWQKKRQELEAFKEQWHELRERGIHS